MSHDIKKNIPAAAWRSERGVALIVVLWIFIFLFVVAFDFSSSVREESSAAQRYNDDNEGYYLALAGFQRGVYEFISQSAGKQPQATQQLTGQPEDLFDGNWRDGKLGDGMYRVRLVDESGKINLNRADENALRRIFTNLGIEEPRRSILVDSIMDWRDPDDLHRISGAESDYYRSLLPPYSAKNGPFDTVEELLWVRGVTSALFFGYPEAGATQADNSSRLIGLREIFTVDSPVDRVNLRTASCEVIHAATGIGLEKTCAFVEARKKLSNKTLADLLPLLGIGANDAAMQGFIFTNPSVVAVQAEGQLGDSRAPRRVRGIIRLGGAQQGYELLRWIDRDMGLPSG